MIDIINTIVSFALLFLVIRAALRQESPVNYQSGFAAGVLIYLVLFTLEVIVFSESNRAQYVLYSSSTNEVGFLTNLYIISFLIASRVLGGSLAKFDGSDRSGGSGRLFLLWSLFGFIGLFALIFGRDFISSLNYLDGAADRYGNTAFSAFEGFVLLYAVFVFCYEVHLRKISIALLLISGFIALGIVSADKNPILIGVICALYLGTTDGRRLSAKKILLSIAGAVTFLVFVPIFSAYRAGIPVGKAVVIGLTRLTLTRMDPSGPYQSIISLLHSQHSGSGYIADLIVLVPKALLPFERGLDPAEQYARDNMAGWQAGMGLGFSPLAEAYSNLGWIGPLIQGGLLVLIFCLSCLVYGRLLRGLGLQPVFRRFAMIIGFYIMVLSFRLPLILVLKYLLYQFGGAVVVVYVLETVRRAMPKGKK